MVRTPRDTHSFSHTPAADCHPIPILDPLAPGVPHAAALLKVDGSPASSAVHAPRRSATRATRSHTLTRLPRCCCVTDGAQCDRSSPKQMFDYNGWNRTRVPRTQAMAVIGRPQLPTASKRHIAQEFEYVRLPVLLPRSRPCFSPPDCMCRRLRILPPLTPAYRWNRRI